MSRNVSFDSVYYTITTNSILYEPRFFDTLRRKTRGYLKGIGRSGMALCHPRVAADNTLQALSAWTMTDIKNEAIMRQKPNNFYTCIFSWAHARLATYVNTGIYK
jgi:hypothetical protein